MKERQDTLYSPNSKEDEAVKALEEELEDAVARYAQDNLLVVRVRKSFNISTELLSQVFLKDPYYQKMTRDLKMSGNAFFGAAGGWLFPTLSFPHCVFPHCVFSSLCLFISLFKGGWLGLCCGLSVISMLEIGYHSILFIIAICKGREMSHVKYE